MQPLPQRHSLAGSRALEAFGTVDIVVNNAGIVVVEPLLEIGLDHWQQTQDVNLRAPLLPAQRPMPKIIEQRRGPGGKREASTQLPQG